MIKKLVTWMLKSGNKYCYFSIRKLILVLTINYSLNLSDLYKSNLLQCIKLFTRYYL